MGGSTPLHGERQEIFRIVVVGATLRTDLKAAKHWLAAGHGEGSPPREQAIEQEAERVDGRHNTADLAPDRHPRRAPGWWALGLTAVACLALGRATVPRDEPDPPTLALPASLTDDDVPIAWSASSIAVSTAQWRAVWPVHVSSRRPRACSVSAGHTGARRVGARTVILAPGPACPCPRCNPPVVQTGPACRP